MPVRPTLLIETPDTAEGSRYLTLPGVDLDAGQARRLFMEYLTALARPTGPIGSGIRRRRRNRRLARVIAMGPPARCCWVSSRWTRQHEAV